MVGIHIDINDRKLADEALKDRENEFRSMFELAAVGNAQVDPKTGRFLRVNKKFCDLTGYAETELLNMSYRDITYPEDRARDEAEIEKALKGEREMWSVEKRYTRKDGKIIWVAVNGTVMRHEGTPWRTVANIIDITERKSYEQSLRSHRLALRNLAAEICQTQEKERRQIADDLHDHIGQNLILAKMKLGELGALLSGQCSDAIAQMRSLLDQSINDIRSLVRDLSPQVLYELGLEAALDGLAEQTQGKYGLRCSVQVMPLERPVREDIRVVLFQAARELLINVAKHARAKQARVTLKADKNHVTIQVADDGCGFDPTALTLPSSTARGFGLFSIRERVALLGGELHIDSAPDQGSRVTVTVPI
jgi:PAS domain S-box-containing protein